jgi:hypothetical protein
MMTHGDSAFIICVTSCIVSRPLKTDPKRVQPWPRHSDVKMTLQSHTHSIREIAWVVEGPCGEKRNTSGLNIWRFELSKSRLTLSLA